MFFCVAALDSARIGGILYVFITWPEAPKNNTQEIYYFNLWKVDIQEITQK